MFRLPTCVGQCFHERWYAVERWYERRLLLRLSSLTRVLHFPLPVPHFTRRIRLEAGHLDEEIPLLSPRVTLPLHYE